MKQPFLSRVRETLSLMPKPDRTAGPRPVLSAGLIEKLADPWDHSTIGLTRDADGGVFLVSETGRRYPIKNDVTCLMPSPAEVERYYGSRNYLSWRRLQDEAEDSYAVRVDGHFSIDSYQPAIDFGDILASLPIRDCLDVGCGALPLPAYMKPGKDIEFSGVDPMDLPVSRTFPFVRAYGDFLPFKDGSFDAVAFPSSLDHTLNPLKALEEAGRLLYSEGYLCVWETIRPDDKTMHRWKMAAPYFLTRYNKRHHWGFTRDSLAFVIKEAGFSELVWHETSDPTECVVVAQKL